VVVKSTRENSDVGIWQGMVHCQHLYYWTIPVSLNNTCITEQSLGNAYT